MDIHINIDNALKGLQAAQEKVHRGIELYGQTASLKMEAYAKENRRWHDRTASARLRHGRRSKGFPAGDISVPPRRRSNTFA